MCNILNDAGNPKTNVNTKPIKTNELIQNFAYSIVCGKVIQTRQFGIKVLLIMNEGEYWLPSSYGNKLAADHSTGAIINMDNIKMTFIGYKPNSLQSPILRFEENIENQ